MSGSRRRPPPEEIEDREVQEEDAAAGSLAPNEELEQAMREAEAALEAREADRAAEAVEPPGEEEAPAEPADELESLRAELEEGRDRLLRLQADFENFRRRSLKEREETYQYGHVNLVRDLLPTVDNLERAIEHAGGENAGAGGLLEGVELVLRELLAVLGKHGVAEIEAEGQPFDPAVHEALAQTPHDELPANTVVQVVQKGYRLRDRLLRPSAVVVSKGPPDADSESPTS